MKRYFGRRVASVAVSIKSKLAANRSVQPARLRGRQVVSAAVFELLETRQMLTAFAFTGSIQSYTVPSTGLYAISAAGGQGGGSFNTISNGYIYNTAADFGAALTGDVMLTAGTQLNVVVGGEGSPAQGGYQGGGGGGSFIYVSGASQPLLVAGGGGGDGSNFIVGEGADAQLGENGGSGLTPNGQGGVTTGAAGGTNGNGGSAGVVTNNYPQFGVGGGGAGWLGNGGTGQYLYQGDNLDGTGGDGPPTFAGGAGPGGATYYYNSEFSNPNFNASFIGGGFGGGGGPSYAAGGGGGGYSGGAGGNDDSSLGLAGGGGSYFGSSVTNTTGVVDQTGNGAVGITGVLVVSPLTFGVSYERRQSIVLTSNDPGNTVTYSIVKGPSDGTLSNFNSATGTVTYTPQTGFTGNDSFTFKVTDGTQTSTSTVTLNVAASTTAPFMSTLSDNTPLSQISLPGTVQSESGPGTDQVPGLDSSLLGNGSDNVVSTGAEAENDEALHITSSLTGAAISTLAAAGVDNPVLDAAGKTADLAASTADLAEGVDGSNSGVGLGLSLTSDALTEVSDGLGVIQNLASKTTAADDTATAIQTATGEGDAGTAAADHTAAAAGDATASAVDAPAGTENGVAAADDGAAGALNGTAGGEDTTAAVLDGTADGADIDAEAQGGVDPVADGIAAAADGAAAAEDTAAATTDGAADASDVAADVADGTAAADDGAATAANTAAVTTGGSAGAEDEATSTLATGLIADLNKSAKDHSTSAVNDGLTAAGMAASAAGDGYTASQFITYASGISNPNTTGGNSYNIALQTALYNDAIAESTTHTASATAEAGAAAADTVATGLDAAASAADNAAAAAVQAAVEANMEAVQANADAVEAEKAAEADNEAAATDEAMAATENAAAIGGNSAAAPLDAAAGVADGVDAGANTAAAVADTTAIALDATAVATAAIPIVDAVTAAAAAAGEAVAVSLDAVSDGADTAAEVTDTAAIVPDGAAAGLDATAVTEDATAAGAAASAATADEAAVTAMEKAATLDAAAAEADEAMLAALDAADTANSAADTADTAANVANAAASAASAAASSADVAFTTEATTVQTIETSVQTQTLSVADQLNAGIRSLDLQAQQVNDTININAGQYFTGATLQDTLNDVTSFLQANPSETIVITLGNENAAVNSQSFNADFNTLLSSSDTAVPGVTYDSFVYSSPNASQVPTLGEVRGKIVFVPNADKSWTPSNDPTTGQQIGWQPTTQIVQNSATDTDPNARWNDAETGGANGNSGLFATDLGNAPTLYTNDLNLGNSFTASVTDTTSNGIPSADFTESGLSPVESGDAVDAIGDTFFGSVQVSRTTGIVGIDDPDQTLITEIADENTLPFVVTSDSDNPADSGTLRDAILEANASPGFNTIEFAPQLTGPTGNTIFLQSNLPAITNDLVVAGPVTVVLNGFTGFNPSSSPGIVGQGSTHTVSETYLAASDSGTDTPTTYTDPFAPQYVDTSGVTVTAVAGPVVDPIDISYGTRLNNSQLTGSEYTDTNGTFASVPGTFAFNGANDSLLHAGNGQVEAVIFTPTNTNLNPSSTTVTVNVAKITPQIPSLPSVNITYGTVLANSELAGFSKPSGISGTYVYTTAAGSLLHADSSSQSEAVTFIPTDTTDYTSVSSKVNVNVAQATPTVTGISPVNISYGTALNNTQLSGTATFTVGGSSVNVPGTFSYTTVDGTKLSGGNGQTENVTFTPADTTDYRTVFSTVTVNVATTLDTPTIVSVNPVNITYGTVLNNSQLSGTATFVLNGNTLPVPGTFSYNTASGTLLHAGQGYTEAVTFTPTDTTDYLTVSSTVTVNVAQAVATIQDPVNITYGTALDNSQLQGTATFNVAGSIVNVPGTFAYVNEGAVLSAGDNQTQPIVFTPTDSVDYAVADSTVTVNVAQATPMLTYTVTDPTDTDKTPNNSATPPKIVTLPGVTPVNIEYSTPLTSNVAAASPTVTENPATVYGSFNVSGNRVTLPGSLTYTTPAGSSLPSVSASFNVSGTIQTFPGILTGTSTGNQVDVSAAFSINGNTVTAPDVYSYTYPATSSSPQQLNATASYNVGGSMVTVPGVLSYTSAAGAVLTPGNGQVEAVTFTPTDTTDYTTVQSTVTVNVSQLVPTVTLTDGSEVASATSTSYASYSSPYTGSPQPATGTVLDANGNTIGTPVISYYLATDTTLSNPLPGAPTAAGNYLIAGTFTAPNSNDLNSGDTISFSITLPPTTTMVSDAGGTYNGSPFPATSTVTGAGLSTTASSFSYVGTGSTLYAASSTAPTNAGTYTVTAIYDGDSGHAASNSSAVAFTILQAPSNTSVLDSSGTYTGSPFTATGTVTGAGGLNTTASSYLYTGTGSTNYNSSTAPTNPGTYAVTASYSGDANHLASSSSAAADFTIGLASSTVKVIAGGVYTGSPLPATIIVTGPGGLNTSASSITYVGTGSTGYAASSTAPTSAGTYTVTATFNGDADHNGSTSGAVAFTIAKAAAITNVVDAGGLYDGQPFAASATVTGVSGVAAASLESVAPTLTYYTGATASGTGSSTAPTNAGTYTAVASFPGSADYTTASASETFTITPATPTISVTDNGGVYTGLPFVATGSTSIGAPYFQYFLQSDTTFSHPAAAAPTNVGSYVAIGFSPANSNYVQVGKAVYFSITPAPVIVTAADAGGTYNGSPFAATGTVTGTGGLSTTPTFSYVGTGSTTYSSATAPTNAGTYSVTAAYAGDANHTNGTSGAVAFTIAKAASEVAVSHLPLLTVGDSSFESTSVNGSYVYDPTTTYWKFTGNAGIEANGSAWNAASAPDGTQAAFLQALSPTAGGSISQTLTVTSAGTYVFTFSVAQRAGYSAEPIAVSVDGTVLATITPSSTSFQSYSTPAVSLSAGPHVLAFATASTGSTDSDSFIDKIAALPASTYDGSPFAPSVTLTGAGQLSTTPTVSYVGTGSTVYAASSTAPTNAGTYTVTASYAGDANHTPSSSSPITFAIAAAQTSVAISSSAASGVNYGQSVTLTAAVSAVAPGGGTPVGSVQFFSNGTSLGTVALVNGSASISTSSLSLGTDAITATYLPGNANFATSTTTASQPLSQPVTAGIVLLDKTGSGALTVSGSAKVVAGNDAIVIDSSSSTAINVSGVGSVTDGLTSVVGGAYVQPYSASVSNLHTGQASAADPLASLATPTTTGLTVRSSSTLTVAGNSVTILQPGLYIGGINVNGAAKVTLAPGEYYLQGGGLNVGGSATLTGTGVFIYNAPTKPTDQINFNGAASVSLSPMTTGTWAGITIFQARSSTNAIFVSGIGTLNVTGTVYAASAAVNISGAGAIDTFGNSLIADDLNISGIGELLV